MSKAQYGEPWEAVYDGILDADKQTVVFDFSGCGSYTEDQERKARVVACVSALAGVPDPAAFVRSHAELLAACEALSAFQEMDHEKQSPADCQAAYDKALTAASAAITNAKGTP